MAIVVKMPVLGQSVEEVRILQWFKREGETVQKGEKLAEIETDKTNMDFDSPESGVVRQILAPVDSYVKVEVPIIIIGDATEPIDGLAGGDAPAPQEPAPVAVQAITPQAAPTNGGVFAVPVGGSGPVFASPRARRVADEFGVSVALLAGRGTGPGGRIIERDVIAFHEEREHSAAAEKLAQELDAAQTKAPKSSPLARAVASDTGADLTALAGSGSGGRIVAGDVLGAQTQTAPPVAAPIPSSGGGTRTVTIAGLRKRVADNLSKSIRNAPHVTLHLQADMTEAMNLRKQLLPAIEKATNGVRVSPTDIVVKACAVALKDHPTLNAHRDGDTITLFDDVHIGLAVSLGDDGLIVPVLKNVNGKGLADLARDRADVAARARDNKLTGNDLSGGTFTVTNLGSYGIEAFNPIIAPPQVAILGVGGIADAVVARNGVPTVRPMMGLSLSFDHAALDGAPAAAFLARVKEILETPYLLLL